MNTLELCLSCKNRTMNPSTGIVCGITNEKPHFIGHCPDYLKDESIKTTPVEKGKFKDNQTVARLTSFLIMLLVLVKAIALISINLSFKVLNAQAAIYFVTAISFVFWFWSASSNQGYFSKYRSYSVGWTIGAWLVPFINLYRPYKMMKELYTSANAFLDQKNVADKGNTKTNIVSLWWALWLMNWISSLVSYVKYYSKSLFPSSGFFVMRVDNLIFILLSVITVIMIQRYSKMEQRIGEIIK